MLYIHYYNKRAVPGTMYKTHSTDIMQPQAASIVAVAKYMTQNHCTTTKVIKNHSYRPQVHTRLTGTRLHNTTNNI